MTDQRNAITRLAARLTEPEAHISLTAANAANADLRRQLAETRAALAGLMAGVHGDEQARASRTFTFRAAGEPDDVTVALRPLGPCAVCREDIAPGAFVAPARTRDEDSPDDRPWTHETCAHPGQPPRPPLTVNDVLRPLFQGDDVVITASSGPGRNTVYKLSRRPPLNAGEGSSDA